MFFFFFFLVLLKVFKQNVTVILKMWETVLHQKQEAKL